MAFRSLSRKQAQAGYWRCEHAWRTGHGTWEGYLGYESWMQQKGFHNAATRENHARLFYAQEAASLGQREILPRHAD